MPNELHTAAADKNGFEEVKRLLNKNPSIINDLHTRYDTTAIEFAAQSGSLETLQYLLQHNAIIKVDNKTDNLLYWASYNKNPEIIQYIANPDNKIIEKFEDGTTYFHAALVAGKVDEVKLQIEQNNSLLFSTNNKSQFSSYWALLSKNEEMIAYVFDKFNAKLANISNHKSQRLFLNSILNLKDTVFSDILQDTSLKIVEKIEKLLEHLPDEQSDFKNRIDQMGPKEPTRETFFNATTSLNDNEDPHLESGELPLDFNSSI